MTNDNDKIKVLELLGMCIVMGIVVMMFGDKNEKWRIYNQIETQMRNYFKGYLERIS